MSRIPMIRALSFRIRALPVGGGVWIPDACEDSMRLKLRVRCHRREV
jgi:hypothetical protein